MKKKVRLILTAYFVTLLMAGSVQASNLEDVLSQREVYEPRTLSMQTVSSSSVMSETENRTVLQEYGDISAAGDGSVTATLYSDEIGNGILEISGTGEMVNWYLPRDIPWYSNITSIKTVNISKGVTRIGSKAFFDCESLTTVVFEEGTQLRIIGQHVFQDCSSLIEINIPDGVTSIGEYAFYGCSGLTEINIPSGVTSIGERLFDGCSGLAEISIPDAVTSIGEYAFEDCSGLTEINIPSGVTSIGNGAFQRCTGLTEINIPDGVTSIGNSAFRDCSSLTSITIPSGVTSIGNSAFWGCSGLTEISIPSGVTSIGSSAFYGCSGLTEIEIPSGVTSIGNSAFWGCSSLTQITIPARVTSIGESVFRGCRGLTEIEIPSGVTSIGSSAFYGCNGLTEIEIPSGVTSIGEYAFYGCNGLTEIEIPSEVTSIGSSAFRDCSSLTSITIPLGVTSIGSGVFYGCSGLTEISIPSGVTSIGSSAFYGCNGLTEIEIPSGVTRIGSSAFYGCNGLTEIEIPSEVTSIGSSAFYNCTKLETVIFEEGSQLTSIASEMFRRCRSLAQINIPSGVTSIGFCAFEGCNGLTEIAIPSGVTSIGGSAFSGCSGLTIYCKSNTYAETYAKNNSKKYIIDDEGPEIIVEKIYTKEDTTIKISAKDDKSGLAKKTYSFDQGTTWQEESEQNIQIYIENTDEIKVMAKDNLGNISEVTMDVKIDIEGPTIESIEGMPENWKNEDVTLTINAKDSLSGIKEYSFDGGANWQKENTKIYYENTSNIQIIVKDYAGNETAYKEVININKVDKQAPTIESIEGMSENWTTENVTLIINANDPLSGIKEYSFDGGENWQGNNENTYTEYTKTKILVKDKAENIEEYEVEIKIDKENPIIESIEKNPEDWTNETVRLIINAKDTLSGIKEYSFDGGENWQEENTKTYEENTSNIQILIKDNVGNETAYVEVINIDNIDKENPIIESVEGNATDWIAESVTLTINANDSLSGIKEYSFDGGANWQEENTKIYSENTSNIQIVVKDYAENETAYEEVINIDKIDKESPIIESVEGNATSWTDESVTLKINTNDSLSGIKEYSFDGGENWQAENTKIYSENTSNIQIVVKDYAENETAYEEVINIDKIDKQAPTIENIEGILENWTNEDATLTVKAKDALSGIKEYSFDGGVNWQEENTKTYEENISNIQIMVKDHVGNETVYEETINIDKIDKIAPTIKVEGALENWTKNNIKVTVEAEDKQSGLVEENTYSFNAGKTWQQSNEYIYKKYEKTQIWVKDKVGNITKRDIEAKIDRTVPQIGTVEISTTEWTEEEVNVSIIGAEDNLSGLEEEPYSFDGGVTWQKENTKTFTENTEGIVICVIDKLGNIITYEKPININNIVILKEITIKENPEKTEYILGEQTDITGLIIEQIFNNGAMQELTEEYTYSPKVLEEEGTQEITLQYKDKTAIIEVKVEKVELASEEYKVEEKVLSNIQPGTTVKEIKEKITTNAKTIKLYNKEGQELKDEDLVTTKTKIKLNNIEEYTLVVRGDATGDGKSDIKDILQINKHRLNKAKLEGEYLKAADVDENSIADIKDILKINKYRLNKINLL